MSTHPWISDGELETWADILLDHSLGGIDSTDVVMLKGEHACWPLMEVLERKVIAAGAIVDVFLVPPNNERGRVFSSALARHGSEEQATRAPLWFQQRYRQLTKYIEVLGAEDPSAYSGLSAEQTKRLAEAEQPHARIRLAKPWVLTLFPTAGYAKMEGMSHEEYCRFMIKACTTDPRQLKAAEDDLAPLFNDGKRITIETQHLVEDRALRLEMSIDQGIACLSHGIRNFPDGEVFTSPDAGSTEGEIFVDLPVHYGGVDIEGIYLRFEGGRIVEYSAQRGGGQLAAIIETDDGSRRLGEVALGMNPGLDRVLKHPLMVEKVGGTLHIAIGASYDTCFTREPATREGKELLAQLKLDGIYNHSAQHVDIVTDFRGGGAGRRVWIDDQELVVKDRIWVVP